MTGEERLLVFILKSAFIVYATFAVLTYIGG